MAEQQITIQFKNKANGSLLGSNAFSKQEDAMHLIKYLQTKAPIRDGEQFYNLFKGANEVLSYGQLSEKTIGGLNLSENEMISFTVDAEPTF